MTGKFLRNVAQSVLLIGYISLMDVSAVELAEDRIADYLSKHARNIPDSQVQFSRIQSPTSHESKDTVSVKFVLENLDDLISSEQWKDDAILRGRFSEEYKALQLASLRSLQLHGMPIVFMDMEYFKTGKEELMQRCRDEYERKMLKEYLGLPMADELSLKELREEKARLDIFGCQLLVEDKGRCYGYETVNNALSYYLKVNANVDSSNAFTDGPFLYVLMRMLIDHPEQLASPIKDNLSSILRVLGKEDGFAGDLHAAGMFIYDWILKQDPDLLGEYHV